MSMHRHTGQGSAATADPVSSATVKRRSLLPLYYENKEQNASRFGICAGFRLGARYRSLGRNDAESLGSGGNEQPWVFLCMLVRRGQILLPRRVITLGFHTLPKNPQPFFLHGPHGRNGGAGGGQGCNIGDAVGHSGAADGKAVLDGL